MTITQTPLEQMSPDVAANHAAMRGFFEQDARPLEYTNAPQTQDTAEMPWNEIVHGPDADQTEQTEAEYLEAFRNQETQVIQVVPDKKYDDIDKEQIAGGGTREQAAVRIERFRAATNFIGGIALFGAGLIAARQGFGNGYFTMSVGAPMMSRGIAIGASAKRVAKEKANS